MLGRYISCLTMTAFLGFTCIFVFTSCKSDDDFGMRRTQTTEYADDNQSSSNSDDDEDAQGSLSLSYPTLYYSGTGSWDEKSYGKYQLSTIRTTINLSDSKINMTLKDIDIVSGQKTGDVRPHIPREKNSTFTRTSTSKLSKLEKENNAYKARTFIMFANSSTENMTNHNGSTNNINYTFSSPLPAIIKPEKKAIYKSVLSDGDLVFNATLTGYYDITLQTTVSLLEESGNTVKIKVVNDIKSPSVYANSKNAVRRDEAYGSLPMSKIMIFTVDTKNEEIMQIDTESEFLVSQYEKLKDARSNGNPAYLKANMGLCKTTTNGETKTYNNCN